MPHASVSVDRSQSPSRISFAPGFNVASALVDRHLAEGRGDKVALRSAAGDVSYAQLAEGVNRCGNALLRLGLERGERLLLLVKDCPEFLYLFFGAIKVGVLPVPLNTILRAADYRRIVEDSGCAAVAWSAEFAAEIEPALAGVRAPPRVRIPLGPERGPFRDLLRDAPPALDALPSAASASCFWLYSSGSTGPPKGAVHRHRDLVVLGQLWAQDTVGLREDDVVFSAAKLFFAYGLGNAAATLWSGATLVLLEARPTAANTLETIARFRPTLFFSVPTLYAAQLEALEHGRPDLSSLRLCYSAGEPLPPDLFHRWKARTGVTVLDGIGSTEVLGPFISNRTDDVRPGTSGRVVPGYEARIVREDGDDAAPGELGVLQVKGASSAAYYWNNPEKTAQTMRGDWVVTGDTYFRDLDGYFHYAGRNDDMLKVGGIWCSPIEIEARLMDHDAVLEVAVVGAPDGSGLVKPEAWVVLRSGATPSQELADDLMAHCKRHLAPYKFPRRIHFVDELPKTATGKIQRYRLRS
jgi:benzoate-CoA ligase family protein